MLILIAACQTQHAFQILCNLWYNVDTITKQGSTLQLIIVNLIPWHSIPIMQDTSSHIVKHGRWAWQFNFKAASWAWFNKLSHPSWSLLTVRKPCYTVVSSIHNGLSSTASKWSTVSLEHISKVCGSSCFSAYCYCHYGLFILAAICNCTVGPLLVNNVIEYYNY